MSYVSDILFVYYVSRWGNIEFPMPFGRVLSPTESFVHSLDEKVKHITVHFLKFQILLI